MRSPSLRRLLPVAVLMLLVAAPLAAQDTTSRGVRIGLTYDPGSKPGVVVLPVTGATRRLRAGDRAARFRLRRPRERDRARCERRERGAVARRDRTGRCSRGSAPRRPCRSRRRRADFTSRSTTSRRSRRRSSRTTRRQPLRRAARGAPRCTASPTISRKRSPACAASRARAILFERGKRHLGRGQRRRRRDARVRRRHADLARVASERAHDRVRDVSFPRASPCSICRRGARARS